MTFADVPLNEEFVEDHVVYTKLSDTQAQGPRWRGTQTGIVEFAADDPVEEFCRWRVA